ncbi:MAG: hypothetical protein JWQ74_3490 [Marmoricola sp.]|nr:hypothetical protein [Marmoricola sp.]
MKARYFGKIHPVTQLRYGTPLPKLRLSPNFCPRNLQSLVGPVQSVLPQGIKPESAEQAPALARG